MKIDIEKLVPQNWKVEKIVDNKIRISYVNKGRGSSPKPFILPKSIEVDEKFVEALSMYLGDGKLSPDLKHLGFSSIDMDLSKFILDFFVKRFNISLKDMTISIRFKAFKQEVLENWAKFLNVPISKLKVQMTQRSKNESCEMEISGTIFRILFEKITDEFMKSDFLSNQELRRAFLRGLFAAEGCIAVNRKENYIVCMNYNLCYDEDDLSNLIKKALDIEGISYSESKRESDKSLLIQITNWQNYLKMWKMDVFRLNARKEYSFLKKLQVTRFSCKVTPNIKERLLNVNHFSHRQIAFLIGVGPATLCHIVNNKIEYISVEYIIPLAKIASVPLEEVKQNILDFRVNDVTPVNDKEFMDFIFNLKLA